MRLRDVFVVSVTFLSGHLAGCGHAAPPKQNPAQPPPAVRVADVVAPLPKESSPITFERIAKYPEPGWNVPRSIQHAPDGTTITFLASESGDDTMSLFAFDVPTGKTSVLLRASDLGQTSGPRSREEELRRERQRDRNEGITKHVWARRANVLVVPHAGDVFVRDARGVHRLTSTPEPEVDPQPCDSGERVAFVRKGELVSLEVATSKETVLTTGATEGLTHGLSDFNAQEEFGEPSGFFWSPRCDRIAYVEVDERHVDRVPILGFRNDRADLMMQPYPAVGTKNPIVRVGVVDLATRKTTWLRLPDEQQRYFGRFTWAEDGKSLYLQTLLRDQKRLALLRVDPATGATTELLAQSSAAWVWFSPMRLLKKEESFLFTAERNGHRHLELRSATDGKLVRELTNGNWDVESIAVDENAGRALVGGTLDGPLERHLYAVPLAGGQPTKLTSERGVHGPRIAESGETWVDVHSSRDRLPRAVVVRQGKVAGELPIRHDEDLDALRLRTPKLVTVDGPGGTRLQAEVLEPRVIRGRHPAVVFVYGGPGSQAIVDSWSPRLLWQHLADRGFVVFQLDNRGTGGRGISFVQQVHKRLGQLELEDQLAGAKWLASQSFVDPTRIGIYGHSYGGFMSALALLEGKGAFKAGVAGAPVIDWRLYDTGYTERYMETPETNAAGYAASDLSKKVDGLTGRLFLIHAAMDENVHFANTAKLVDALIAKHASFDLLVLPGERHGTRAPAAKSYVPERVVDFFVRELR
jgi:dipeptidyl-peptidase 4